MVVNAVVDIRSKVVDKEASTTSHEAPAIQIQMSSAQSLSMEYISNASSYLRRHKGPKASKPCLTCLSTYLRCVQVGGPFHSVVIELVEVQRLVSTRLEEVLVAMIINELIYVV